MKLRGDEAAKYFQLKGLLITLIKKIAAENMDTEDFVWRMWHEFYRSIRVRRPNELTGSPSRSVLDQGSDQPPHKSLLGG